MAQDGKMTVPERILSDAKLEAERAVSAAQTSAEAKLAEAKKEADELIRLSSERARKEAEEIVSRRTTLAQVESRKIALSRKKAAIESVYVRTGEKLAALKEKDYLSLIEKLLLKYAEKGETVDVSLHAPVSAEQVRSLRVVKEKALKVEKTAEISGGLIIRNDKFDKDLSFDSLLSSLKDGDENEIAKKLFG